MTRPELNEILILAMLDAPDSETRRRIALLADDPDVLTKLGEASGNESGHGRREARKD